MKKFARYEIWMDGKPCVTGRGTEMYLSRKDVVSVFNRLKELWPGNEWDVYIVYEYPPEKVTWGL